MRNKLPARKIEPGTVILATQIQIVEDGWPKAYQSMPHKTFVALYLTEGKRTMIPRPELIINELNVLGWVSAEQIQKHLGMEAWEKLAASMNEEADKLAAELNQGGTNEQERDQREAGGQPELAGVDGGESNQGADSAQP